MASWILIFEHFHDTDNERNNYDDQIAMNRYICKFCMSQRMAQMLPVIVELLDGFLGSYNCLTVASFKQFAGTYVEVLSSLFDSCNHEYI